MMNKELYQIWAPIEADKWTRFAKPALFIHVDDFSFLNSNVHVSDIPFQIKQLDHNKTMIIVDLPGEASVQSGLGLAKIGYRPVPLYNGIHETKIGGLSPVVDNQPIVDALVSGADILKGLEIENDAPPAFLLDYDRAQEVVSTDGLYDNRWSVDFEDLPEASHLKANNINRVVIWTEKEMRQDLTPIIESYRDASIQILTYIDGEFRTQGSAVSVTSNLLSNRAQEQVRKFENARFSLLLITIVAFVNLFFMFIIIQPILYTAPSIMWMTYVWVSEGMGDVLAIALSVMYLLFYLLSQKNRNLMIAAFIIFGIDIIAFYSYAFIYYGVVAFTEGYLYYGLLAFLPPLFFITSLFKGARSWKDLKGVSETQYLTYLDQLDGPTRSDLGNHRIRRRRYRGYRDSGGNYRGYRGYGGSGSGGYSGSGYRSSGGGYGGGYGG